MNKLNCSYIFSDYLSPKAFFYLGIFLIVAFSIFYIKLVRKSGVGMVGLGLFYLGAFANLTERYRKECVNDYFSFFGLFSFNLWDILVTVGIVLILWSLWKTK